MRAPSRAVRVIWNQAAGEKPGAAGATISFEGVRDLLARHGLGDDVHASSSEEEGRALARQALADGCDVVIAAGGDGTIGTVATELLGETTALGVLPLGSIMNVPRMLSLPLDPEEATAAIASGRVRTIDVGRAKGGVFYEAGSVGMNAAMFREAERFGQGDWASILRTVWVALRYRPARMAVHLDERTVRTRALMVTVSNGPYIGAGMTVAPDARLDDGRFDVRIFRRFSKWQLVRHLASIAFGRRRYAPEISTYRSARVRIESAHPLPARADSHDLGTTPVEFEVWPRALRVIVPDDRRSNRP